MKFEREDDASFENFPQKRLINASRKEKRGKHIFFQYRAGYNERLRKKIEFAGELSRDYKEKDLKEFSKLTINEWSDEGNITTRIYDNTGEEIVLAEKFWGKTRIFDEDSEDQDYWEKKQKMEEKHDVEIRTYEHYS